MITIFTKSWNLNALANDSDTDAETAAMSLINSGFQVKVLDILCPNENVGAECETDEEEYAVNNL